MAKYGPRYLSTDKISNVKCRVVRYQKQNIEVVKYRTQVIEGAKHGKQNIERQNVERQNVIIFCLYETRSLLCL